MKIGEISRRSGIGRDALRWYERIGLLPRPTRASSGHRDYDPSILTWIEFLGRLKATGMPIRQMLRYAALREQGVSTEDERRRLLEEHREGVKARIAELQDCLTVLDAKIETYTNTH